MPAKPSRRPIRIVRPHVPSPGGPVPIGNLRDGLPPVSVNPSIRPAPPPTSDQLTLDSIRQAATAPKRAPANKDLVERAKSYERDLPSLLQTSSTSVREFFLTEVLPLISAVSAGMADGKDIVRLALNEDPDPAEFDKFARLMRDLSAHALRIKTVSFLASHFRLTPLETEVFRLMDSATTPGVQNVNDLQAVLREMFAVSRVQRPAKGNAKVQVRPVPADKGDSKSPRPAVRRNGTKR